MYTADDLVGQQIGNYEIQALVGRGAMARVYRAIEHPLERVVALKVMASSLEDDPTFARRFLQEARAIGALHHPNILPIYHYGEWHNRPYIVTELMSGGSVQERLKQEGFLSVEEAVDIISQIGSALEEAHSHGIIHRDLKPSNILLARDGRPVLADFGIAKIITGPQEAGITQAGTSIGTPEYMSPEQAMGAKVDRRSDIYSLGVVLYRLLTGRLPFERDSNLGILIAHTRDLPPPPRSYNPQIPAPVEAVIMRCLEKDPARRFQTASDMVNALQQAIGSQDWIEARPMPPLNPVPVSDVTPDPVPTPRPASTPIYIDEVPDPAEAGFEPPTSVVSPNPYRHRTVERPAAPEINYPPVRPEPAKRQPDLVAPVYSASYPAETAGRPLSQRKTRPGWLVPLILGVLALLIVGSGLAFLTRSKGETTVIGGQPTGSTSGGTATKPGSLIFGMVENGKWDIYSANPDGSAIKKLTTGTADNISPALSPDGKTLLYVAARAGGRWQIRSLNLGSGNDIALTPGDSQDQYPAWSPDGKQIVFSSNRETGGNSARLYIMTADGNQVRRLNDDNAGYSSWSPSNFIVYSYYTGSIHALRRVDPVSGATTDLTIKGDPAEYDLPVWSPDGKQIVAVRGAGADRAIYLLNSGGGGFTRVTPAGETATNPSWSPDGKRITYLTRVGTDGSGRDRWELAQINTDGSQRRQLTSDGRQKFYLIWGAL
jgi:serine/threonine protein kinase/Tol biopolymer transport system component